MSKHGLWSSALVAWLVAGCDEGVGDGVDDRGVKTDCTRLNGAKVNGVQLNGTLTGDMPLNGTMNGKKKAVRFDWARLPGGAPTNHHPSLAGGVLRLGELVEEGVEDVALGYTATSDETSTTKQLWVRDAQPVASSADVWSYDIDLKVGSGPWEELCVDEGGNPTRALVIGGLWTGDGARVSPMPPDPLTYACMDSALARCVLLGYRPWASQGGVSLADHHQACARMLRADYCGTGEPHTPGGVAIHVRDALGIQGVEPNVAYVVEAEWGPDGAACLNAANKRQPNQAVGCSLPACGAAFASGGLVQSGVIVP